MSGLGQEWTPYDGIPSFEMSIVIQLATPVENVMRGKGVLATWKINQREMSKHVNLFRYSLWGRVSTIGPPSTPLESLINYRSVRDEGLSELRTGNERQLVMQSTYGTIAVPENR